MVFACERSCGREFSDLCVGEGGEGGKYNRIMASFETADWE